MEGSNELLVARFTQRWHEIRSWPISMHFRFRRTFILEADGDILPKFRYWPAYMRRIFFCQTKPPRDLWCFQLILYFICNDASVDSVCDWILSCYRMHCASEKRVKKRIDQLAWVSSNIHSHPRWYYYDVTERRLMHVNGRVYVRRRR